LADQRLIKVRLNWCVATFFATIRHFSQRQPAWRGFSWYKALSCVRWLCVEAVRWIFLPVCEPEFVSNLSRTEKAEEIFL